MSCLSFCVVVVFFPPDSFVDGFAHFFLLFLCVCTPVGAEIGATTSIFPFSERMVKFLEATGRKEVSFFVSFRFCFLRLAAPLAEKEW